ncbi:formate/nitrite transporter family protein [Aquibacillus rhizosphaerae]|uniref:Formate/nitrite transporter family protein n=1 Tax=Aquibacillus rhizosphaerae TaxID=3051431 RepID=A0ABT7L8R3_9BACI|nr:formate/nitrite transporter family protein [Aquibacillus sp. LR5S19]MDL4842253.1 formate/nitrite transporter family protein [Aquibacillus sp. LR5S19]
MGFYSPQEIANYTVASGKKKANLSILESTILGFQAGAFIALGFLLYIRVTASMPAEWGSFSTFIGASLFPLGLILTLMAGGELLTGNMMAVPLSRMAKKISTIQVCVNLIVITISNFIGALFVAYFFGHVVGLTETGVYLTQTIHVAEHKLDASFVQAFVSGIGCNWLVASAVWLSYGAKDMAGKVLSIWFPTMAFVAIGFQHVVANMFLIPAAIFAGYFSWTAYLTNFIPVFLGNAVGGIIFVAGAYWIAYLRKESVGFSGEDVQDFPLTVVKENN